MFAFIPLAHDRTVHGPPLITFGIIAICVLASAISFSLEAVAADDLSTAAHSVESVTRRFPDARVDWRIEGLPRRFTEGELEALVDEDPHRTPQPGDEELDRALRGFVAALNRVPVLRLGYRPAAPSVGTLMSSMWMHGDIFHLLGNMMFLFVGGTVIESRFSRLGFVFFYLAAGVVATLAHHFVEYASLVPLVGASGAIAGVLGAAFVLHPRTRITFGYVLFLIVFWRVGTFRLPAWVCIPAWAGLQILDALAARGEPVAFFAHIGGFAFGIATALLLHRLGMLVIDYDRYEVEHAGLAR